MSEETRALEELMRDFKEHNTKYAKNYEDVCYSAIQSLQQQLKDKDEKISRVISFSKSQINIIKQQPSNDTSVDNYFIDKLLDIIETLESNKED